jgi:hypothetical protein
MFQYRFYIMDAMRPIAEHFSTMPPGMDIMSSFVIIICSLMVYFGTKEIYELSEYKGLKYFRSAFLFFAIAYFFRSVITFFLMLFDFKEIFDFAPHIVGMTTLFLFMYFSAMAVFYLFFSILWKKWSNRPWLIGLFHFFAVIIALLSIIHRNIWLHIGTNLLLFILMAVLTYIVHKDSKKKKNKLYAVYVSLFFFWTLNMIDVLVPRFFDAFTAFINLASVGIFLLIVYKVLKKAGT